MRQIVYYLCLSLIDANECDRQISISLTNFTEGLQLQIATNDPQVILTDPVNYCRAWDLGSNLMVLIS